MSAREPTVGYSIQTMSTTTTATATAAAAAPLYVAECREMTAIWSILDSKSLVDLLAEAHPDYSALEVRRLVAAADEILTAVVPLNATPAVQRAFLKKLDAMNRFAARLRHEGSTAARRANRPPPKKTPAAAPKPTQEEMDAEAERVIMAPTTANERRRLADQARRQKHKEAFAAATAKKPEPEPESESSESESESSESESSESESEFSGIDENNCVWHHGRIVDVILSESPAAKKAKKM